MSTVHSVKPGDTMVSIAHQHGFREWRTIYDHPDNEELRKARPDPDVLNPGDQVFIPDKEPRVHTCATERRHRFKLKPLKAAFRLVVRDHQGVPLGGRKYRLDVEGQTIEDTLGGDALIEREIKPTTRTGKLTVWPEDDDPEYVLTWDLQIGHLDPVTEPSGWRARLFNMGFACDPSSTTLDAGTVEALKQFQARAGLPVTGQPDDETLNKIKLVHGA
jgi:hypothetical protein